MLGCKNSPFNSRVFFFPIKNVGVDAAVITTTYVRILLSPLKLTGPLSSHASSSLCQTPVFNNHYSTLCLYRFGCSGYCL